MRQAGYSLVELMVALTLGMLVTGAALAVYMSTFSANSSALKIARLNNELRSIMTFVSRDLKRAGYWGTAEVEAQNRNLPGNPAYTTYPITPTSTDTSNDTPTVTYESITFAYDLNNNGTIEANEQFGFRYDPAQKAVDVLQSGVWSNLSDESVIEVTSFSLIEESPAQVTVGTNNVQVRKFTLQITGRLKRDPSVVRQMRETVRVRNEILS